MIVVIFAQNICMAKLFFTWFLIFLASAAGAQDVPVDKSPLDVIYYPANYPVLKIQDKVSEPPVARLFYSRPQKAGRVVFGELIEYGKVWRLGANEATELELFQPVTVNKTRIKKGRYTLYAIPSEKTWTIIFNRETDTWGTFRYNPEKDILRVDLPVSLEENPAEFFSAAFEKNGKGILLKMKWDKAAVSLPISL